MDAGSSTRGKLAGVGGIHVCVARKEQKIGAKPTLVILVVLAGIVVLIAWFAWSYKTQRPVPTAPKPASQLTVPRHSMGPAITAASLW